MKHNMSFQGMPRKLGTPERHVGLPTVRLEQDHSLRLDSMPHSAGPGYAQPPATSQAHVAANQETLNLIAIPGMRASIRKGLRTPVDKCAKELDG